MLRQSVSFTLHRVNASGLACDPEMVFWFRGEGGALSGVLRLGCEQQVPPLRYAPVGMTLLFGVEV
jgi:hypothetical protein